MAEVRINLVPVDMIVDTGAESVLVTPETAAAIGLPADPTRQSIARGIGGETQLDNVLIDRLDLGGLVLRGGSVPVGRLPVAEADGRPISGIIGSDVLSGFDVDMDMPGGAIRLYRPGACAARGPSWAVPASAIPANRTERGRLFLPVRVDGHLLLAVLDTGFSSTTITTRAALRIGVTREELAADQPAGVTRGVDLNDQPNRRHAFGEIRIGQEVLRNRPVIVADLPTSDVDMLIGMDFVRNRRLWLAYSTSTVFVDRPPPVAVSALP